MPRVEKAIPVAGGEPRSTVKISKPGDTAPITGLPKPEDVAAAEKRKTSRISLDAALSDSAPEAEISTKTIRLKRPGEAPTVRAGAPSVAESDGAASQTQRKTVIVKRQLSTAAGRKLSVARASGEEADAASAASAPMAVEIRPHGFFGFTAVAATLVLCVVIYVFAAQALGPNSCMTQYSIWVEGPNLSWPNKIQWK